MLLTVSSSVNMIQAFHHVWISQNQTNIKLQNQAPSQIPKNDNPKVNKYTGKDFRKNRSGTVGLDPTTKKPDYPLARLSKERAEFRKNKQKKTA